MTVLVYILFILLATAYLCGLFDNYRKPDLDYAQEEQRSLIEHLTQYKLRTKNYQRAPGKYHSFNRMITASRQGDNVHFQYEFPLIESYHHTFSYTLEPRQVSADVEAFGIPMNAVEKIGATQITLNTTHSPDSLASLMNQGCWYYRSGDDWGIDFKNLVGNYRRFTAPVAHSIYEALQARNADSYVNRVQAALNFVQFIPYGIPDFDTEQWYYHELAVPPESFILNYADCDSKSVFMAAILSDLIPRENFILVQCMVRSANERTSGGHMMIAVSDLGIQGEMVSYAGRKYLLLETTAPWIIGKTDWESIEIRGMHPLI